MDAREGKPVVADAARREKRVDTKFNSAVWNYSVFVWAGITASSLAPGLAVKAAPAAVDSARRFLAGGYDLPLAVAFFTTVTLLMQGKLARVVTPSPSPRQRLTPFLAWYLAIANWGCLTSFFFSCLTFGDEIVGGYGEWAAAAGASVASLVMSTRTVRTWLLFLEGRQRAQKGKEDATQKGKEDAAAKRRLLNLVRNYSIFLYVGFVVSCLAPSAAVKYAPDAVASAQRFLAGGYDLSVTVAFFAAATLLLQAHLARVLKPSPRPRLTPLAAWSLAAVTWLCITFFFLNCLTFGDENVGGYDDWAAAAGASVANLVMSARTVMRHLA